MGWIKFDWILLWADLPRARDWIVWYCIYRRFERVINLSHHGFLLSLLVLFLDSVFLSPQMVSLELDLNLRFEWILVLEGIADPIFRPHSIFFELNINVRLIFIGSSKTKISLISSIFGNFLLKNHHLAKSHPWFFIWVLKSVYDINWYSRISYHHMLEIPFKLLFETVAQVVNRVLHLRILQHVWLLWTSLVDRDPNWDCLNLGDINNQLHLGGGVCLLLNFNLSQHEFLVGRRWLGDL